MTLSASISTNLKADGRIGSTSGCPTSIQRNAKERDMISWVVKVWRHGKQGTQSSTTIPCGDYGDARKMAAALGSVQQRSAEVHLAIAQPRGGSVFLPAGMLDNIRDAIDDALNVMTAPAPKMPAVKTFPAGSSMDEIEEYIDDHTPKLTDKFD